MPQQIEWNRFEDFVGDPRHIGTFESYPIEISVDEEDAGFFLAVVPNPKAKYGPPPYVRVVLRELGDGLVAGKMDGLPYEGITYAIWDAGTLRPRFKLPPAYSLAELVIRFP